MFRNKSLISLGLFGLLLCSNQSYTFASAETAIETSTPIFQKGDTADIEDAKAIYAAKLKEYASIEAKIHELKKIDPNGDYIINDQNKNSFYATTSTEFIKEIGQLSKEIYGTGETDKHEIQKLYDEEKQKVELENDLLYKKINEYINFKEEVKSGVMSPSSFQLLVRARFGDYARNIDINDATTRAKQIEALDAVSNIITSRIDSNAKAIDNMDIYYLVVQRYPVVKYGYFKDYIVVKTFYRHEYTQFSGALLYSPSKNHLVLAFPGTVTGADWGRNLSFTKHPGELIPNEELSLHKGFVKSYNEIKDQINSELNRWVSLYINDPANKDRILEVTTTGHSKGAAMSTIAAIDIAANILTEHLGPKDGQFPWKVNNPNFASPRFAGTRTSKLIEEKYLSKYDILRFVNYWDVVPSVVAEFTGSKHVGVGFVFSTGFFEDMTKDYPIVNWHNMEKYAELSPIQFEKCREAGKTLATDILKLNKLKTEIQDLEKQHGFHQKGWLSGL
ncbi:MAG: hypothetical protein Q8S31_03625 [Alphaproteobacteria bacterium]|nr:hypothetical protein [Alphaproteobacteria bacterium]